MFRRGGRPLNLSAAIGAGQLVVLTAQSGGLPIPLEVNGDPVQATGVTVYQFLVPIDQGDANKPTTQKAEQ